MEVHSQLFTYPEDLNNRCRRHLVFGYLSPEQFEQQFLDSQCAASLGSGLAVSGMEWSCHSGS